jgi:transposase-like protein
MEGIMTIDQIEKHYGTLYKAARAIGCHHQQLYNWRKLHRLGVVCAVPMSRQKQIQSLTKGKLKAEKGKA